MLGSDAYAGWPAAIRHGVEAGAGIHTQSMAWQIDLYDSRKYYVCGGRTTAMRAQMF